MILPPLVQVFLCVKFVTAAIATLLTPAATHSREIGKTEAANLDMALRKATADLRGEFNSLFARYNSLILELSSLNKAHFAAQ